MLKALSNIISILNFNPSRTKQAKDVAVEHYSHTLDEIEALTTSAIKRGEHAQQGLQFTGEPNTGSVHSRDKQMMQRVMNSYHKSVETSKEERGPAHGTSLTTTMPVSVTLISMEFNPTRNIEFLNPKCPGFLERKKPGKPETRNVTITQNTHLVHLRFQSHQAMDQNF